MCVIVQESYGYVREGNGCVKMDAIVLDVYVREEDLGCDVSRG